MARDIHPPLTMPVSERDNVRGPANARVTLVEYGDFECPHCGKAFEVLNDLMRQHDGVMRLVYRHFPLSKIHPHARAAAEASEAAAAQKKFWLMHDLLFVHQDALEPPDLLEYAQALQLDLARFERELEQGVYSPRIAEDISAGLRSGVNGTPTFFINGRRYNGSFDREPLGAAIEAAAG